MSSTAAIVGDRGCMQRSGMTDNSNREDEDSPDETHALIL